MFNGAVCKVGLQLYMPVRKQASGNISVFTASSIKKKEEKKIFFLLDVAVLLRQQAFEGLSLALLDHL